MSIRNVSARSLANLKPFQPGNQLSKGHNGRPRKLLLSIEKILAEENKHPLRELLILLPQLPPMAQAKIWLDLLPYIFPKQKEEVYEPDKFEMMNNEELLSYIKERVPQITAAAPLPEDK